MGNRKIKGNMDVEIAVDALELVSQVDHMVFLTGDGDFTPLVVALQRQGVRVSMVSSIKTQPPFASDELRRACDNFIELDDLRDVIARPNRVVERQIDEN